VIVSLITFFLAILISSTADAFCDTLVFHGGNTRFWHTWFIINNPNNTWKKKDNNWMADLGWFGKLLATTVFVFMWDWWHRFKFIFVFIPVLWLGLIIGFKQPIEWWYAIVYYVVYSLNFTLWFNVIIYKKS